MEAALGDRADYIVQGTGSIVDNILLALDIFDEDEELLVLTCDIPMITPEALEHFIKSAKEKNVDLCYSIVEKSTNDDKYPEVKRTYAKLKKASLQVAMYSFLSRDKR